MVYRDRGKCSYNSNYMNFSIYKLILINKLSVVTEEVSMGPDALAYHSRRLVETGLITIQGLDVQGASRWVSAPLDDYRTVRESLR